MHILPISPWLLGYKILIEAHKDQHLNQEKKTCNKI